VELPTFPTSTAPPENSVAEIVRKWERMFDILFGEYLTGDDKEYTTGYTVSGFEKNHSFKVKDKLADKQFECVRGEMADLGDCLNIAAADEHVPKV